MRETGENRDVYEFNNLVNEELWINISVDISACLCVWSWVFTGYFYNNQLTIMGVFENTALSV